MTNSVQTAMLRFFYPSATAVAESASSAAAEAARHFALLDRTLEDRDWLAGDHRTAADLFLFMVTRWGRRLEAPAWEQPQPPRALPPDAAVPGVQQMIDEQGLELP